MIGLLNILEADDSIGCCIACCLELIPSGNAHCCENHGDHLGEHSAVDFNLVGGAQFDGVTDVQECLRKAFVSLLQGQAMLNFQH